MFAILDSKDRLVGEVVNIKYHRCDVYIGRPSKWGNPFTIGIDGNREEVIDKYRAGVMKWPKEMWVETIKALYGKTLGCYCRPNNCHGEVLLELMEKKNKRWRVI